MKNKKLSVIIKISILSAMAFILYLFEFPLPIFPGFLKIDISDLPAMLGGFALGPIAGIIIQLLKNVLHILIRGSSTAGIGELANFIVGAAMVAASAALYKNNKSKKNAAISLTAGVLVMTLVASVANYYVFLPLYESALHFPIEAMVSEGAKVSGLVKDFNSFVVYSILPFNLLKGLIVAVITFLSYKKLSPILHK